MSHIWLKHYQCIYKQKMKLYIQKLSAYKKLEDNWVFKAYLSMLS